MLSKCVLFLSLIFMVSTVPWWTEFCNCLKNFHTPCYLGNLIKYLWMSSGLQRYHYVETCSTILRIQDWVFCSRISKAWVSLLWVLKCGIKIFFIYFFWEFYICFVHLSFPFLQLLLASLNTAYSTSCSFSLIKRKMKQNRNIHTQKQQQLWSAIYFGQLPLSLGPALHCGLYTQWHFPGENGFFSPSSYQFLLPMNSQRLRLPTQGLHKFKSEQLPAWKKRSRHRTLDLSRRYLKLGLFVKKNEIIHLPENGCNWGSLCEVN